MHAFRRDVFYISVNIRAAVIHSRIHSRIYIYVFIQSFINLTYEY